MNISRNKGDEVEIPTPPIPPITPTAPTPSTESVTTDIPEVVRDCENYDGWNLPHPFDCSLYLACDEGGSVVMACVEGLYFDQQRNLCGK